MDLFSYSSNFETSSLRQPLAEILRPKNLDEILGQNKTFGPHSKLGQLIRGGQIPSLILWGPPGTGKTSFAKALAQHFTANFVSINAVESGVKVLREAGEQGREKRRLYQQKTILFVDEIHRFNKAQQDVLLPYVEAGDLILIGATTENPSYELNRALLSRCRVLVFEPLSTQDLQTLLDKSAHFYKVSVNQVLNTDAVNFLISYASGDARKLLNSAELIFQSYAKHEKQFDVTELQELLQFSPLQYDKNSEYHYDLISAFIKSVRGSDPDAAIYYMTRMLEGGEDPIFIARRLIILASEDIGNAEPQALTVAVAGMHAVETIGLPEASISLAQVTIYLACCPKSNRAYLALQKAREVIKNTQNLSVPLSLRSSRAELSKTLGYGRDYKYPHDYDNGWVEQEYLPKEIKDQRFYEPSSLGREKFFREHLDRIKKK